MGRKTFVLGLQWEVGKVLFQIWQLLPSCTLKAYYLKRCYRLLDQMKPLNLKITIKTFSELFRKGRLPLAFRDETVLNEGFLIYPEKRLWHLAAESGRTFRRAIRCSRRNISVLKLQCTLPSVITVALFIECPGLDLVRIGVGDFILGTFDDLKVDQSNGSILPDKRKIGGKPVYVPTAYQPDVFGSGWSILVRVGHPSLENFFSNKDRSRF